MSNYHLRYAISKRTPVSPKIIQAILAQQAELNRHCTWTHERLNLAPDRSSQRPSLTFPMFRIGPARPFAPGTPDHAFETPAYIADASAFGSTKVKENAWNAALIVAFLKSVSADYPELLMELRDDGGFVLPGAVWIKNGNVELQREWLNRERERVLEASGGDLQAAAPYVWAEAEALEGRFFVEASVLDYQEVREIRELEADWEDLRSMSLGDVADLVVDRVTSSCKAPATV